MKYTIHIDQSKCVQWGLNFSEGALVDFFSTLSTWADPVVINEELYFFASRNKVINELPMLTDKPDTVYRLYKSLSEKGIIDHIKEGKRDLVRLTGKGKKWNSEKNPTLTHNSENFPTKLGKKSEKHSENFPTDNNTIIDKYTNDKKETPIGFFDPSLETRIGKKHYQLICGAAISCDDSTMLNFLRESESAEILFDWLEYKKEKRQTYKTEHSIATLIEKKFMPFTLGELQQAYQDSVTANWAGIFPKKQNKKDAKKDEEPRFGAARHSEIEKALAIRKARRQQV